jgi:hypothetical protein
MEQWDYEKSSEYSMNCDYKSVRSVVTKSELDEDSCARRSTSRTASAFRILLNSILSFSSNFPRMLDFSVELDQSRELPSAAITIKEWYSM